MTPTHGGRLEDRVALVVRAGSPFGRAVMERFIAEGARAVALEGDLGDPQERRASVEAVVAAHSRLDILVVPTPPVVGSGVLEADADEDRAAVDGVVRTTFFLVQEAAGVMRRGGRVCIAAPTRPPDTPNDATAPATSIEGALIALVRLVAVELAPRGIAVNALCPIARDADPVDVAAGLVFLASDDASYVLGASVPVGGGDDNVSAPAVR